MIMINAMIMTRIIMSASERVGDQGESVLCLCADGKGAAALQTSEFHTDLSSYHDDHYKSSSPSISLKLGIGIEDHQLRHIYTIYTIYNIQYTIYIYI